MSAKKILITTGIVAGIGGLVWGASYLIGKKKVGDKLDTVTTVNVHSLNFKGLTLRIDVILKNPTEGTLKIKQPYVKILFENKVIGTSQVSGRKQLNQFTSLFLLLDYLPLEMACLKSSLKNKQQKLRL